MKQGQFLSPRFLQAIGVLMLVGSAVFWAVTGQQSALLVGASLSLIGLGAYGQLHISIGQDFSGEEAEVSKNGR